jgi:hypothetical protein
MALVSAIWQAQLLTFMNAMYTMTDNMGDEYLARNISNSFGTYIATAQVLSVDLAAAVPAGVSYVGAGVGTVQVVTSTLFSLLYGHFRTNNDDTILAMNIANDFDIVCKAAVINTVSTGVALSTTPPPVPFPFGGPGMGNCIGVSALIQGPLLAAFMAMKASPAFNNLPFAQALATGVTSYLQSAQVPIILLPPFVAGTGVGKIV